MWEGFDPSTAPLESSIISAEEWGNLVCSRQFFTSETSAQGRLRAYIEIYYDNRWADARPTLLLLQDIGDNMGEFIKRLVHEGYVVAVPDYCGARKDDKTRTSFPTDLSFAAYPACMSRLNNLEGSARQSPWFVWSKLVRRAISLLEEQRLADARRIGIIGIGAGGHLAWQVAGMDRRVRCLAPICGGGYRWTHGEPRFSFGNVPSTEEEIAYSTGVGAETYAKFVTCPTFFITSVFSVNSDVDRAGDILNFVKSANKKLLIVRSMENQITEAAYVALMKWLRSSFEEDAPAPIIPQMSFEAMEQSLYVRVKTISKADNIKIFANTGEISPLFRNWVETAKPQKVGLHEYIANIPISNPSEVAIAYATCAYGDGSMASTPVQAVIPAKLGATQSSSVPEQRQIIYDNGSSMDIFLVKTPSFVLKKGVLHKAKGPYDIEGVTVSEGMIAVCRSAKEISELTATSALHFDAYSKEPRDIRVSVYVHPDGKRYSARAHLKGGEFWQKLLLCASDFKSDEGRNMSKFTNAKMISVSDAANVLLNNFLWI